MFLEHFANFPIMMWKCETCYFWECSKQMWS